MPVNTAASLAEPFTDLVVDAAPYPTPGPGQVVVRNRAVAVNPLDVVKQSTGDLMYRWLGYPAVLGEDVAGEVVEVGGSVTRFRVGDRVLGYAVGMEKGSDHRREGGFQHYTVLRDALTAAIPDAMAFEDAAVLPLGVSTAASALFGSGQLRLEHPQQPVTPRGRAVVVWGGSTSVGGNAIQLAVAAGYTVVSTASPHNHDQLRRLGASEVFDRHAPHVVADVVASLRGTPVAGVLAVGTGSAEPCVAIAAATGAPRVALTSPSVSLLELPRRPGWSRRRANVLARLVVANVTLQVRCALRRVRARYVWGSALMNDDVGPMLWRDHLPDALADGRHVAVPRPEVIGIGLEHLQPALDALRAGVSARKLVVGLADATS